MFTRTRRRLLRLMQFGLLGACLARPAAWADPPALVARLERFAGTATFLPAGSDTWAYADINRPLSNGDRLWIGAGSRAELVAGPDSMRLGANTDLGILELRESASQLRLTQGTFEIRVRTPMQGRFFEIDTPNLAFDLGAPGDYRVDVDPVRDVTTVIVRAGRGTAYGAQGAGYPVGAGQLVRFAGADARAVAGEFDPPRDAFDDWVAILNRREDASVSARYVGIGMTGYEDLDRYGTWRTDPLYGAVWVPNAVAPGWAPYHDGHWAWIAPWGWTWIDDEPWGFAPFHYGRWARVDADWVWVPGPVVVRPVYAPALVAFIGGAGSGVNWSVSLSNGAPGIAWFALAPGEVYRPVYAASPAYVDAINRTVIVNRNVTIVRNTTIVNNIRRTVYVNRIVPGAVAAVPAAAFVQGRSVRSSVVHLEPRRIAASRVLFSPPVAPVRQSVAGRRPASPPPRVLPGRAVVATRNPPPAPALHDVLARRFAERNGAVPGAGRPFVAPRVEGNHPHGAVRAVTLVTPRPVQAAGQRLDGSRGVPHPVRPGEGPQPRPLGADSRVKPFAQQPPRRLPPPAPRAVAPPPAEFRPQTESPHGPIRQKDVSPVRGEMKRPATPREQVRTPVEPQRAPPLPARRPPMPPAVARPQERHVAHPPPARPERPQGRRSDQPPVGGEKSWGQY